MLSRFVLSVLAASAGALALAAPAVAQDEAALIQKRNQVREMARDTLTYLYQLTDTGLAASLTLSGTKFFKDSELH
ncbi:MAG TPA: hypothetical protein VLD36_19045 [Burkholderiales bacterium]|nr:hypothetical protein [Burkholderiales bacterium]